MVDVNKILKQTGAEIRQISDLVIEYPTVDSSTEKTTVLEYFYDNFNNVIKVIDYGEVVRVDLGGNFNDLKEDKITLEKEYAVNEIKNIYSWPKREIKKDFDGNIIGEGKIYYDGLAYGNIEKGNVTKAENLMKTGQYISSQTEYNQYGLPISQIDANGNITSLEYDSHNLHPSKITNAKNQVSEIKYNYLWGKEIETKDPNGARQAVTLDPLGRVVEQKTIDPNLPSQLLTVQTTAYNLVDFPTSQTTTSYLGADNDSIEIVAKTYFDKLGRKIQTRTENNEEDNFSVSSFEYGINGQVSKEYLPRLESGLVYGDPTTPITKTIDDGTNANCRPPQMGVWEVTSSCLFVGDAQAPGDVIISPDVVLTVDSSASLKIDFKNNKLLIKDQGGVLIKEGGMVKQGQGSGPSGETVIIEPITTEYSYDVLNRVISIKNPLGETTTNYDLWENTITDANGHRKELTYNARQNLQEVREFNGSDTYLTRYYYDANQNLTRIVDAEDNMRDLTYDLLGRKTGQQLLHKIDSSEVLARHYSYDDNGNLKQSISPNNETVNLSYDELSRLTSEDFIDQSGVETTYIYDQGNNAIGRLNKIITASVTKELSYDLNGNVIVEKKMFANNTDIYETELNYDNLGNLLELTHPDNSQVQYSYNQAGQLDKVDYKSENIVDDLQY